MSNPFGLPPELWMWLTFLPHIVAYFVLSLAFLRWCRRTRHWSFGVLALSFFGSASWSGFSMFLYAQRTVFGGAGMGPFGSTTMLFQQFASMALNGLHLIGAVGLLLAAQQLFSSRDEAGHEPAAPPPRP